MAEGNTPNCIALKLPPTVSPRTFAGVCDRIAAVAREKLIGSTGVTMSTLFVWGEANGQPQAGSVSLEQPLTKSPVVLRAVAELCEQFQVYACLLIGEAAFLKTDDHDWAKTVTTLEGVPGTQEALVINVAASWMVGCGTLLWIMKKGKSGRIIGLEPCEDDQPDFGFGWLLSDPAHYKIHEGALSPILQALVDHKAPPGVNVPAQSFRTN